MKVELTEQDIKALEWACTCAMRESTDAEDDVAITAAINKIRVATGREPVSLSATWWRS